MPVDTKSLLITFLTGGVVTAMITGLFSLLAARAAAKTARLNNEASVRADQEKEAFQRAKNFYNDIIDRQDAEIKELTREIRELKDEVSKLTAALRAREEARQELLHDGAEEDNDATNPDS